jgi:Tol biopolymer transport system component
VFRVDRDGKAEDTGIIGSSPALDASGQHVVVVDPNENIWVVDLETGGPVQLTFTGASAYPRWSTDGKSVILGNRTDGAWRVLKISTDGTGETDVLMDDIPNLIPTSNRDGTLMGYRVHSQTSRDIWIRSPGSDLTMLLETDANERGGSLAPGGGLYAYVSDEEGTDEVYLRQIPDTGRRWRVSTDGGAGPVWSRDGGELFFRNGFTLLVAEVSSHEPIRVGTPREFFTSDRLDTDSFGNKSYDSTPGGELMISLGEGDDIRARVVLNWRPEGAE